MRDYFGASCTVTVQHSSTWETKLIGYCSGLAGLRTSTKASELALEIDASDLTRGTLGDESRRARRQYCSAP